MNDRWDDLIRRELTRPETGPAHEDFYRGVWNRIRDINARAEMPVPSTRFAVLGEMCWRSAPLFAALLLVLSAWIWFHPADPHPEIMASSESYVLDTEEAPSNSSLLYQITHTAQPSETEGK
jgi:hypothetical protein